MLKIATVRVTEDFLEELLNFVKDMKLDKSSYLRDILKKGFDEDRQERLLLRYQNGELSVGEVCNILDLLRNCTKRIVTYYKQTAYGVLVKIFLK